MVRYLTISLLLLFLLPILLSSKNTYSEGDSKIVFEFSKSLRNLMLFGLLLFLVITIVLFIISIIGEENGIVIGIIIFALFAILSGWMYLLLKNKKLIYENGVFELYNILGKKSSFNVIDIKEGIEHVGDGMKLVLNSGKKIKVDAQMSNYSMLKEILEKSNIIYKDSHGNIAPKGW